MPSIKNKACTLPVGQIEKNPILALSTGEKDVENYKRVTKAYGNVTPAVACKDGDAYRILAGQARLEACAQSGIREMPVIVSEIGDESEQMKLALLLSTVREEGGPLSEGAFIDALITRHGVSRRELMVLLKKSKSWISKRQSLSQRLSEDVKGMVKGGVICARTAEEVAKLPEDEQFLFASKIASDGLSKTSAGRLASLYIREEAGSAVRKAILDSPLAVLDACAAGHARCRMGKKRGLAERIASNAGFIFRLAYELGGLLSMADTQSLVMAKSNLDDLRKALADLKAVLDGIAAGVFPGKHQGGEAQ